MDIRAFEALEGKINLVLDRMKTLQEEKQKLQNKVSELESLNLETSRELESTKKERDHLQGNQRDPNHDEMVRNRIAALLEKLEAA